MSDSVRSERGLTLVELIIVIVVTGILVVATLPFFKISVDSYIDVRSGKDILQSARIGFNRMMAEMRIIESSNDIDWGYSNEVQFDLPNQGKYNITYEFEDGQLKRENKKLIDGVQSFVIRYYRADGSEKGTPFSWDSDVWRIQVEMKMGDGDNNLVLRAQVSPRNIHYS